MKTSTALAALLLTLVPAVALGYGSPALYGADPAHDGGGGGRIFTGSPADGWSCDVCHRSENATQVSLKLVGGPTRGYTPGETYAFTLNWVDEHLAFTAEVTDTQGRSFGELQAPPKSLLETDETCTSGTPAIETLELERGHALALSDCGAKSMRLQWTAPDEKVPGALYIGLVAADGDGTPQGDHAALVEYPLTPQGYDEGCSIAPEPRFQTAWSLYLLVIVGSFRRRATRTRRRSLQPRMIPDHNMYQHIQSTRSSPATRFARYGLVMMFVTGKLTGCASVKPYERGRLAQPDMALSEERDLDVGPDHALDYREGSAGGLGGNGGGCGCN